MEVEVTLAPGLWEEVPGMRGRGFPGRRAIAAVAASRRCQDALVQKILETQRE